MQLPPFRLERFFAQYEFTSPYPICLSDCESVTIGDLLALEPAADAGLRDLWLGYTESAGSPGLRAAVAALYTTIAAEHVLMHSGAEEAIFNFMHALVQPGDHVIVHWPGYQSLAEVARSIGADVSLWTVRPEDGWQLDLDDLRRMLRPDTRAVVVNLPHNPTGFLPDAAFVHDLAALADRHGFLLFGDEVYRGLEQDAAARLPALCDLTPQALSLGVMSKTYGLAGLRIGWIATRNREIFAAMAQMKDYTTICNSAPSEYLAELALRHADTLVARNLAIIHQNLGHLDAFFAEHAERLTWVRPSAGPIAFPAFRHADADAVARRLVEETGVLILPGDQIDPDFGRHFRLGFGRKSLADGLARFGPFLQTI
ncbi:MAG: aminotransferase class I/II-fold pyridoxal phosphate-dependent enzyme [Caldilineaceae bacterium]|nr:aminotransferase class I/II-fold pyridoxal phosphate-dependent enzyme [Caldilineaceae bacterium]